MKRKNKIYKINKNWKKQRKKLRTKFGEFIHDLTVKSEFYEKKWN
jgi:hypothetical protein